MTTLTQLIEQYCPNGVEYVRLGDVAEIARKTCQPARMGAGSVVLYSLPSFDRGEPESVDPTDIKSGKTILAKPSLLVPKLNPRKPRVWLVEEPSPRSYCSTEFFPIQADNSSLSLSYLYYVICDTISELAFLVDGGSNSHKRLNRDIYLDFVFPLPPREVQDAIVERLDAFAKLIESLDSEISLREKRFEYFREQLLTFDESDGVEYVKLGEVGSITRGRGLTKKDLRAQGTPAIHYGQIYTYYGDSTSSTTSFVAPELTEKLTRVDPGSAIVACTSENIEDLGKSTVWLGQSPVFTGLHTLVFEHQMEPMYVGHWLRTYSFFRQKLSVSYGTKVLELSAKAFSEILIPLPSLEIQRDIADKLDTMQALIDNLKHERELRRTQFEYYREKLLTFNS